MNYNEKIDIAKEKDITFRTNISSVSAEQYYIDLTTSIIGIPPSNAVVSDDAITSRINGDVTASASGLAANNLLFANILNKPNKYKYKQCSGNKRMLQTITGENGNGIERVYAKYTNILQNHWKGNYIPTSKGKKFRIIDFLFNYQKLIRIKNWENKIDVLISRKGSHLYKFADMGSPASITEELFENMVNNNNAKWAKGN